MMMGCKHKESKPLIFFFFLPHHRAQQTSTKKRRSMQHQYSVTLFLAGRPSIIIHKKILEARLRHIIITQKQHHRTMLSRNLLSNVGQRRSCLISRAIRAKSTQVESTSSAGPIGADGRHEVWREGIYDHDNEPK
jgi:hypothetical protein